jgi:hypothetical protein
MRLFPDYRAREKDFYSRTDFYPIMQTLVIREDLYERHPWIAESLGRVKTCRADRGPSVRQSKLNCSVFALTAPPRLISSAQHRCFQGGRLVPLESIAVAGQQLSQAFRGCLPLQCAVPHFVDGFFV